MSVKLIKKFNLGYKGNFGSKQKRFHDQNQHANVGPGQYTIPDNAGRNTARSVFKSTSKRKLHDEREKDQSPAIGSYKVN